MAETESTAILLAGGFGTRIRALYPDIPKPLIPVAGRPFLEWVLRYWRSQGIGLFVISAGYRAEQIARFAAEQNVAAASCITDEEPLGTGGAIRLAASSPEMSDPFVVLNGDSLVLAPLSPAWEALKASDGVVLAVDVPDASRYGRLDVSEGGRLAGFCEKE